MARHSVKGLFFFWDTMGIPIDIAIHHLREKKKLDAETEFVLVATFVADARRAGWSREKIRSDIREANLCGGGLRIPASDDGEQMSEPNAVPNPIQIENITDERAARRFHQIVTIERQIGVKSLEIANCKQHLSDLKEQFDGLIHKLREAARDEGDLPLFDLDGH